MPTHEDFRCREDGFRDCSPLLHGLTPAEERQNRKGRHVRTGLYLRDRKKMQDAISAISGNLDNLVTEQEFEDYKVKQGDIDNAQDAKITDLDSKIDDLSTQIQDNEQAFDNYRVAQANIDRGQDNRIQSLEDFRDNQGVIDDAQNLRLDGLDTKTDALETQNEDQDARMDYLDGEIGLLNSEFQNLASQITDLTQRVTTLESEIKPIYDNFTNVWNNPTGTELEVPGTKLSFVLTRNSNGTYLPYLRNLGQTDINIWFRSTQKYESSGNTDYSLNSVMTIPAGGTSDKLDNDSYGLGYGTYPNYTRISIQINETGEFYIWEMQSSSRSGEPIEGVISSAIRRYF